MILQWSAVALGAAGFLLLSADPVTASAGYHPGETACPALCNAAGPYPSNWSLYHNFDQLQYCNQALFLDFSLYDDVDNPDTLHRLYSCTSYGADWANQPKISTSVVPVETVNATYQIGWSSDGGVLAAADISTLSRQIRRYLVKGYGATNESNILFARSNEASVGVYLGSGIEDKGVGSFALKALEDHLSTTRIRSGSIAMQLCISDDDGTHFFGLMATSNGTFSSVQAAIKSWSAADCLSFDSSRNITGPAMFTTSLLSSRTKSYVSNVTNNTSNPMRTSSSPAPWRSNHPLDPTNRLSARSDCRTIQVQRGDGCPSLAIKCGISGAQFTKFNPSSTLCGNLIAGQHVCCSAGSLPDFTPKPNADGSCFPYSIKSNDVCKTIAAAHGITVTQLDEYNTKTWAWPGCSHPLWVGTTICLSSGTPPMPAYVANAICGPQKPGTKVPPSGTDIATLNPCPLNACCDAWGQCGVTEEFCTSTTDGAPGTAASGTNGCISNCGTNFPPSSPPAVFRRVGYFEGFNLDRKCLYQDVLQIDFSNYTHLHFGFASLTPDYQVQTGNILSSFEFNNFKRIEGPAKIVSFGGWAFSTDSSTYNILRNGVLPANRDTLAKNIANFVNDHDLDGVDIDWEYPGAPDIPNIPPASADEGYDYIYFLFLLKGYLPDKSVSIAAPSSYWYLKNFPIQTISMIVDYIVFMTYDLHGQWDANSPWSQSGCPSGMCLRSGVNLTETLNSLVMITKAGVPSNKIVVGVTSYGRSFAMADPGCYGPDCFYTGTALHSNAEPGVCTGQAGYIANAEIKQILSDPSRVNQHFIDDSDSNILVYDNTQWVSWMDDHVRSIRTQLYQAFNFGGTTDWATDLESYHPVPPLSTAKTWPEFISKIKSGGDPYEQGNRTGNWTTLTCTDPAVQGVADFTSQERWNMLDCPNAWEDLKNVWVTDQRGHLNYPFSAALSLTMHGPENTNCSDLQGLCPGGKECTSFVGAGSGPAAYEIWNSWGIIHAMFVNFNSDLQTAWSDLILPQLTIFEDTFAPIPPAPSDQWIFLLVDLVTLGVSLVAGPFFDTVLSGMAAFADNPNTLANLKDATMTLIGQSTTIAKDALQTHQVRGWTPQSHAKFTAYMGQAVFGWSNFTMNVLADIFCGSDNGLSMLTTLMSNGQLIEGSAGIVSADLPGKLVSSFEKHIAKSLWAYTIPTIWSLSPDVYPFVIDSGYGCDTTDPLSEYLSSDTMHSSGACISGKLYYLATPKGKARESKVICSLHGTCHASSHDNSFSALPGIDTMNGGSWAGITVKDVINGSVNTYQANNNANGASTPSPYDPKTVANLIQGDFTTPGYIRLPVCSPDVAFAAWNQVGGPSTHKPSYPCIPPMGVNDCRTSTFVDQTSGASPLVSDCLELVKEVEGMLHKSWEVSDAFKQQKQLLRHGTCRFGIQGTSIIGNIDFHIGSQDIIDIINQSIKQFGGSGRVGAKGDMSCDGDVKGQPVLWGLY